MPVGRVDYRARAAAAGDLRMRQPMLLDELGVVRFRANPICAWLQKSGRADLNEIGRMDFSDEDRRQFAQLLGYSVSGYGDLSYVSPEEAGECDALAAEVS